MYSYRQSYFDQYGTNSYIRLLLNETGYYTVSIDDQVYNNDDNIQGMKTEEHTVSFVGAG